MSSASKQETDRLTHQLVSRVNLSSSSPELLALSTQYQSPGVGLVLPSITISKDGLLEEWLCPPLEGQVSGGRARLAVLTQMRGH